MANMQVLKKSYGVSLGPNHDGEPLFVIPKGTPRSEVESMGEFVMAQLCDGHFVEKES